MERYDSLGVVGEGSYGLVLKCRHRETGQIVAVKKFLEGEEDQNVKKIALREVRMLKKLRHENLINLIEFFRRKRRLYLVFEFVDHTILDELEENEHGLEQDTARQHVFQVLRGIAFCHQNQIIHRDVKPENVLVSQLGVVKLCDFGFARLIAAAGESCTDYVATRWYRAPELLVGDTKYSKEVDVWAVGCLMAEMLSGNPLFPGESDIDQLFHIIQTLGDLSMSHRLILDRNPMMAGLRLPSAASTPLTSTFPSWSVRTHLFVGACLKLSPSERPPAEELLSHDFFTHDRFSESFLPQLRQKVQEEFAANVLLHGSRKSSGSGEKRHRRNRWSQSPENVYAHGGGGSEGRGAHPPRQDHPVPSKTTKPSMTVDQMTSISPLKPSVIFSTLTPHKIHEASDEGPLSFPPPTLIPPLQEPHKQVTPVTPSIATPSTDYHSSFISGRPSIITTSVAGMYTGSPAKLSRTKRKTKKSPPPPTDWNRRNPSLVVQGQGQGHSQNQSHCINLMDDDDLVLTVTSDNITPFSLHPHPRQLDTCRHPYAISLDRTKDSHPRRDPSTRERRREPLCELKDNSREDILGYSKDKRDPTRRPWFEVTGCGGRPKNPTSDIILPTVTGVNQYNVSPKKSRQSFDDFVKTTKSSIGGGLTMPSLGGNKRSSLSSSDSTPCSPVSNLPFV